MSRLAILALPYPGHINPMMALAAALFARGHAVTVFHLGEIVAAPAGVSTERLRPTDRDRWTDPRAVVPGVRTVLQRTGQLVGTLPAALAAGQIDAVIADQLDPGAGLAAMCEGLPWISVACALLVNRDQNIPPPFTSWAYSDSPIGRRRNEVGWWVHDRLMAPLSSAIGRWASAHGLPQSGLDDCLSPYAQISQTVAGFDFPRSECPPTLHYVGPIRSPDDAGELPVIDGRPLVFASLGTLQGHRAALFRRIADAAATLDLQLILAHGGRLPESDVVRLRGSPVVRDFVPQRRVLQRAATLIGHGGMNTVMDALAAGVPIVAIPLAYEQAAIGARLVRSGAGLVLRPAHLTSGRLVHALRRLLNEPAFAIAAHRLQAEIGEAGGVDRAADIVERVLQTASRGTQSTLRT